VNLINLENLSLAFKNYKNSPFDHCVIDNFLKDPDAIESEFLNYDSDHWITYDNIVQHKKLNNDWFLFPEKTYQLLYYLNSQEFLDIIKHNVGCNLYSDPGLNAGGWHIHGNGGTLNPHLDYSVHPKLPLLRKLNLIIYLSKNLDQEHGGHFGLWDGVDSPGNLVKEIAPVYNRAIIFDTTQNSWHGLSRIFKAPEGVYRKSIAVYYLTDLPDNTELRYRALFGLVDEQKDKIKEIDECPHLIVSNKN